MKKAVPSATLVVTPNVNEVGAKRKVSVSDLILVVTPNANEAGKQEHERSEALVDMSGIRN